MYSSKDRKFHRISPIPLLQSHVHRIQWITNWVLKPLNKEADVFQVESMERSVPNEINLRAQTPRST